MVLGLRRTELGIIGFIALAAIAAGVVTIGVGASMGSFTISTVALAGLAWLVSFATEQVGERFGPEVTGLLQSTLGNLPEFFVVLFALREGQTLVATTSLIGSIFANALLVLGITIVVGAWKSRDGFMRFGVRLPTDTSILLQLAVFLIVIIGIATASHDVASQHTRAISVIGSIAMLVVYGFWVQSYLKGSKRGGGEAAGATADERAALAAPADEAPVAAAHAGPRVAFGVSLALLAVAGVGAAFVSEWFVQGIEPAVQALGISEAFAGLVIVAIAGNAVENATAVVLAAKGQSELALSVVKNSVSQISVFLFPVLVLVSQGFDTPLTFGMDPVWIAALALTAITVWQITGDGIAAVWEGVALIAFYVILATVAFYE